MKDAELAEFVRERLASMEIKAILEQLKEAHPGRELPSRSAIGRFAIAERGRLNRRWWRTSSGGTKEQPAEPTLPFVIEADPELAMMVRSLAGRMSLETMLLICRTTFPKIILSRSELARAVAIDLASRHGRRRRVEATPPALQPPGE